MTTRLVRRGVAASAILAAALLAIVGVNSTRWIGATFPGFFVMPNRVVASVALPGWLDVEASEVFQHQVIAVDGMPVASGPEVYARVAAAPPGTPIEYTLRAADERTTVLVAPSRRFSGIDYALVFGAYFLNGLAFTATGLLVYFLKPRSPASRGLLVAGLATGIFVITGADLYGPHWFFRLHVVAESMMGAGFFHLALVFPTDRLRGRRRPALGVLYAGFAALAVWYEAVFSSPSAYTAVHLVATAAQGLSAAAIIAAVSHDFLVSRSPLVRRRTSIVVLGSLTGFLVPGVVMLGSAVLGGTVAVNTAALTAFFFPASLGYAVVKGDLFDIDVMLRRGITYVLVVLTIAAHYFVAILLIGLLVPHRELLMHSPLIFATLNLGLLFLAAPVRARVQDAVDRVFFRKAYDAEQCLAELSHALASAHTIDEVIAHAQAVFVQTLCPASVGVFLREAEGRFRRGGGSAAASELILPPDIALRAEHGEILARYEWDDGSGRSIPAVWDALQAELLVPVRTGAALSALIGLGGKLSGRAYTLHDSAFLATAASQVALAIKNAAAFEDVQRAYRQLERNQTSLVRADRLATLGRLTAGIAHEVNTPLAAVLNSLKLLADLGHEYRDSVGDPTVGAEDHRQIADEIVATARDAAEWARKAAAFVSKVKMHGREAGPAPRQRFAVRPVVLEVQALLAHRLRAASCRIEFTEEPEGVTLVGEPTRLGQILVNLVANAIDAYEDGRRADGRIEVAARRAPGSVTLTVSDQAGGIPEHLVPRLFDELFTTKDPGRGTGLGLWIARNLVEQSFGGTLTVETTAGTGSCFTATVPAADEQPAAAFDSAA